MTAPTCGAVWPGEGELQPKCLLESGHEGPHRAGLFSWRDRPLQLEPEELAKLPRCERADDGGSRGPPC